MITHRKADGRKFHCLLSFVNVPLFSARLVFHISSAITGKAKAGRTIAHIPYPHLHVECKRNSAAAFEPAKAEMSAGEEVNAKARPRFLRLVMSAARTFQEYARPPKPTE